MRSGQSIIFPEGDVTVLGSVASGAEIVAGGSIHVYGTLRGRAMAGINGNSAARIYCQKIEAELLAIDGYYQTAEEFDAALRDRPAQAWLEGETCGSRRSTDIRTVRRYKMAKVLVVTSGKGGVGKTTSTAAIGAALAQNGKKVVVVDFDVGLRNLDLVHGRRAPRRVRSHQRGAGRRQAAAGADPRQAAGERSGCCRPRRPATRTR